MQGSTKALREGHFQPMEKDHQDRLFRKGEDAKRIQSFALKKKGQQKKRPDALATFRYIRCMTILLHSHPPVKYLMRASRRPSFPLHANP